MRAFISVASLDLAQVSQLDSTHTSDYKKTGTYTVHNEETLQNLDASLEALKEIIRDQRAVIRAVQHDRDLLAAGYAAAMKECEELKALLKAFNDSDTSGSKHG